MSVLAKHTVGKGGPDKVFRISGMAKARAAVVGKENITNATTGSFLAADGSLMTLKTVEETVKETVAEAVKEVMKEVVKGTIAVTQQAPQQAPPQARHKLI